MRASTMQPITDALAADTAMLPHVAESAASRWCERNDCAPPRDLTWKVAAPVECEGERLVWLMDDGTEVETPPMLVVEFDTVPPSRMGADRLRGRWSDGDMGTGALT